MTEFNCKICNFNKIKEGVKICPMCGSKRIEKNKDADELLAEED